MASAAANQDPIPTRSIREQDELLEAIYRAHAAHLRGRLLRSTRDPAVADDLASEAFIRLAGGDPGGPCAAGPAGVAASGRDEPGGESGASEHRRGARDAGSAGS